MKEEIMMIEREIERLDRKIRMMNYVRIIVAVLTFMVWIHFLFTSNLVTRFLTSVGIGYCVGTVIGYAATEIRKYSK